MFKLENLKKILSFATVFFLVFGMGPYQAIGQNQGGGNEKITVCFFHEEDNEYVVREMPEASLNGLGVPYEVIPDETTIEECEALNTPSENTPPTITLIGDATIEIVLGGTYTEEGATVEDAEDDPEPVLVTGGDTVDTGTVGTYVVTYDATDLGGASATQVTRTVNVVEGIEPEQCPEGFSWNEEEEDCVENSEGNNEDLEKVCHYEQDEENLNLWVVSIIEQVNAWSGHSNHVDGQGDRPEGADDFLIESEEDEITCVDYSEEDPTPTEYPYGVITNPTGDEETPTPVTTDSINLTAEYFDGDESNDDNVQWAVRFGTCVAGTNTVFGNVDGHSDTFSWILTGDRMDFSSVMDVSELEDGNYCFVFNPTDDGEVDVRETAWFSIGSTEEENEGDPVVGCMNPEATNYNPLATVSDDSCSFGGGGTEDIDVCSNLDGDQSEVPEGLELVDGQCVEEQSQGSNNSGGGGSSGSRPSSGGGSIGGSVGEVLGAFTGDVLSNCVPYINAFLRLGLNNDSEEVKKLQGFLNEQGIVVPITGFFGPITDNAVRIFQKNHKTEVLFPWKAFGLSDGETPTGYVFKTTKFTINNMICPDAEEAPILP